MGPTSTCPKKLEKNGYQQNGKIIHKNLRRMYRKILYQSILTNLKSPCGKFDTNGGFRFQAKLIAREPGKYVGFTNTRVPNQDDLK